MSKTHIILDKRVVRLYGTGGFALELLWQVMPLYLLFYYTDVLGLSPGLAGAIFMAALIWDGITDPIIGAIATRTGSERQSFLPWIQWGVVPMGLSFVAMFALGYVQSSPVTLAALCLIAHCLYRSFFTCVGVPYGMMATSLTQSSQRRNGLAVSRMLWGFCGALITAAATLPLVNFLGGGNQAIGFFRVSLIYAFLAMIFMAFFLTKFKSVPSLPMPPPPRLHNLWPSIISNKPLLVLIAVSFIFSFVSTIQTKTLIYYFKYNIGREALAGAAFGIIAICVIVLTPFWSSLAKRRSKRFVVICGLSIIALGNAIFLTYSGDQAGTALIILSVCAIGTSALPVMFWSMLPDTNEVSLFTRNVSISGMIYGLVALFAKLSAALGALILGKLLHLGGYVANTIQSPETLSFIHKLLTLPMFLGSLICIVIIHPYGLSNTLHVRLVRAIERKSSQNRSKKDPHYTI